MFTVPDCAPFVEPPPRSERPQPEQLACVLSSVLARLAFVETRLSRAEAELFTSALDDGEGR
jgi:hypothetical protein